MWILKDKDVEKLRIKGKVDELIKLLREGNPKIRADAAEALGDFDKLEVIEALLEGLKDEDRKVRWNAAKSLEYLCKDKIDLLIEVFSQSSSVFQKVSLAWLLGRYKIKKAIPALAEALEFGDKYVRRACVIAMGSIGDEKSLPYLISALKDHDPVLRKRAAEALGRIGIFTDEVKNALLTALTDPDSDVRSAAAKTLETLGWKPESNEELAKYYAALKLTPKLVLLGDAAIEPLTVALKDEDWNTKIFASEAFSGIRSRRAVERLFEVSKSDDWTVRFHALSALSRIMEETDEKEEREKIAEHMLSFLNDSNPNVREVVIESLRKLDSKSLEELAEKHPEFKEKLKGILFST
ncbi:MAG: HEAT repeat domain-containing protein [Archaeoglobus sp.]|nr:HEAT repeat domain-containing protein [Archaeoglobus sp.]